MKFSEIFVHDFDEDLRWSECPAQYLTYMQAIVYWWPNATGWDRIVDLLQQKQGKDITIELPDGQSVNLQFKSRRSDYGDMCIEYRHDFYRGSNKPGWIETPSNADYLLYCVPKYVYRLDYKQLHTIWLQHKDDWIKLHDLKPAPNKDYETRNVGVSFEALEREGVEVEQLYINPGVRPTPVQSIIHWPAFPPSDDHPTWPREQYEEWINHKTGTPEQLKRYAQAIIWYEAN
jgi:hypothetical protein